MKYHEILLETAVIGFDTLVSTLATDFGPRLKAIYNTQYPIEDERCARLNVSPLTQWMNDFRADIRSHLHDLVGYLKDPVKKELIEFLNYHQYSGGAPVGSTQKDRDKEKQAHGFSAMAKPYSGIRSIKDPTKIDVFDLPTILKLASVQLINHYKNNILKPLERELEQAIENDDIDNFEKLNDQVEKLKRLIRPLVTLNKNAIEWLGDHGKYLEARKYQADLEKEEKAEYDASKHSDRIATSQPEQPKPNRKDQEELRKGQTSAASYEVERLKDMLKGQMDRDSFKRFEAELRRFDPSLQLGIVAKKIRELQGTSK